MTDEWLILSENVDYECKFSTQLENSVPNFLFHAFRVALYLFRWFTQVPIMKISLIFFSTQTYPVTTLIVLSNFLRGMELNPGSTAPPKIWKYQCLGRFWSFFGDLNKQTGDFRGYQGHPSKIGGIGDFKGPVDTLTHFFEPFWNSHAIFQERI